MNGRKRNKQITNNWLGAGGQCTSEVYTGLIFSFPSGFTCTQYGASAGRLNCLENDDGLVFCGGSASVPRGVVTQMFQLSAEAVAVDMCTVRDLFEPIDDVQFCDGTEEPFM